MHRLLRDILNHWQFMFGGFPVEWEEEAKRRQAANDAYIRRIVREELVGDPPQKRSLPMLEVVVRLPDGQELIYPKEYRFSVHEGGYLEIWVPGNLLAAFSPIGWHAVYRKETNDA